MDIEERCISKKEYLKRNNSNVGYALYVQNNIKKDDYARLNTGEIVKVIGIKENNVNKKAIYYGIHGTDWFDNSAVENFSNNIIDLIEIGDYVNGREVKHIAMFEGFPDYPKLIFVDEKHLIPGDTCKNDEIRTILTHEQFEQNSYKV
ncbi:MAG: hypothetical protein ACLTPN_02460 [Clostridia bacterium]